MVLTCKWGLPFTFLEPGHSVWCVQQAVEAVHHRVEQHHSRFHQQTKSLMSSVLLCLCFSSGNKVFDEQPFALFVLLRRLLLRLSVCCRWEDQRHYLAGKKAFPRQRANLTRLHFLSLFFMLVFGATGGGGCAPS